MPRPKTGLYYPEYLQLDKLLSCQTLESEKQDALAHDEMLFIIVHQAYELWFKQILWELDAVHALFRKDVVAGADVGQAVSHLSRVVEIQRLLIQQIDVLETMTPLDFLDFRDYLIPASGFQSTQFRLIENLLGLRPQTRLDINETPYHSRLKAEDRARVHQAEAQPSLLDLLDAWLARTPFLHFGGFDFWAAYQDAVQDMLTNDRRLIETNATLSKKERIAQFRMLDHTAEHFAALFDAEKHAARVAAGTCRLSHDAYQAALLINLYRNQPILHLPYRFLSLLMDIDEHFTTWRYRHALMALRMIGTKIGTGGSSGHEYLRKAAEEHKIFKDLLSLSTFYIPRSKLPALPPDIVQQMGFRLED